MNDKYCVVVYPRDIKFIYESGTISYYVDRKVSDYVKKLQDKLTNIENENRRKDIDKLQLQSNWNSLREWLEQQKTTWNRIQEHGGYDYEQILDKMNELEEEKKIPEKLDIKSDEAAPNSYYILNEYGTKCYLTKHSKVIADKVNKLIDKVNKLEKEE